MNKARNYVASAIVFFIACCFGASSQTYVRYVKPQDLSTRIVYRDSVLTSIVLPRGVSALSDYPPVKEAVEELSRILADRSESVLKVYVCGSSSPDGLYGNNAALCKARTDEAVTYIRRKTGIPASMIHAESLDEDWNRLAELVAESDIPYRDEVLDIIAHKTWGERKTALQKLDSGKVWEMLYNEFFPLLRCVRFAIFCKWDPSKPYLSAPDNVASDRVKEPEPSAKASIIPTVQKYDELPAQPDIFASANDTVYVYDTVFMKRKTTVYVEQITEYISGDTVIKTEKKIVSHSDPKSVSHSDPKSLSGTAAQQEPKPQVRTQFVTEPETKPEPQPGP